MSEKELKQWKELKKDLHNVALIHDVKNDLKIKK
jgi:hypothetical protein